MGGQKTSGPEPGNEGASCVGRAADAVPGGRSQVFEPPDVLATLLEFGEPANRQIQRDGEYCPPKPDAREAVEAVELPLVRSPHMQRDQVERLQYVQMKQIEKHRCTAEYREHV